MENLEIAGYVVVILGTAAIIMSLEFGHGRNA
jgi:hypothetical protein